MIHIVVSRINGDPQDVERVCARKLIATRTMALVLSRRWWERKWEEKRKGVGESLLLFPAFFPSYLSITPAGYAYFAVGLTFFIIIFFFYFRRFDVEGDSQECPDDSDYAKVYDGLASWSPVIRHRFCGRVIPPAITSKSNKLRIEFQSNSQYAGRGFDAEYTVLGSEAEGMLSFECFS